MSILPHSHFSTDDIPEKDRQAAWREDISVIFDHEAAPITEPRPFHAVFDVFHFGHSVFANLNASPGRYTRSTRKIAQDGMDSILLQLFLEGGVQFGVGSRTAYAEAGDIVVFDLAQPVDNINRKFRHITTVWPRPTIEAEVPDIARWHGLCLPRDTPSVTMLRQHMLSSYDLAGQFTPQEGLSVEQATLALARAAMRGNKVSVEQLETRPMKEMFIYQIKRYIRQNLGGADQSPEQIASQFGISRRHLYQLLEPVGGIARYQRQLRLQRCLADLQSPEHAHLRISEIAYRWGFRNPATFNRNFRAAFGLKPLDARHHDQRSITSLTPSLPRQGTEEAARAEHQHWFMALGI